jgi:DNA polymerase-2
MESRIAVPNRYFGLLQSGEIKMRGIETRRKDTPPWIHSIQLEILEILAKAPDAEHLPNELPAAITLLHRKMRDLRFGKVKVEDLLVRIHLSRAPAEYKGNSASMIG